MKLLYFVTGILIGGYFVYSLTDMQLYQNKKHEAEINAMVLKCNTATLIADSVIKANTIYIGDCPKDTILIFRWLNKKHTQNKQL